MRIYVNAAQAIEEIKRDLAEMGIRVIPASMQDKIVLGNPEYETLELQNYSYCILNAKSEEVPGVVQPWASTEFYERIENSFLDLGRPDPQKMCIPLNPGEAYKLRSEVWNEFLHDGKFAYTYNERLHFNNQLRKVMKRLLIDPGSRQLWVSLWNPAIDPDRMGGVSRVPCSLGYNFQVREGKLNIHYIMRSCDFATHMMNDIYLAIRLLEFVAYQTGYEVGDFTHTIFSLHVYQKDVKGVF